MAIPIESLSNVGYGTWSGIGQRSASFTENTWIDSPLRKYEFN